MSPEQHTHQGRTAWRPRVLSCVYIIVTGILAGCSDHAPNHVTQDDRTERVVSLAPSLTEIVCAVGAEDLLVGRTTACDYPPQVATDVPAIGGFGVPSLEMLVSVSPTLVLDVALADESVGRKIENLGLLREQVRCRRLDDIPQAIRHIGRLLGKTKRAQVLAEELETRTAELRKEAAATRERPSVYVEIWHDPMTTAGKRTFLSELIHLAGGHNIGDEVDSEYFQVSPEWVVARNPDIILCFYMARNHGARTLVLTRAGWQQVRAIRNRAVYDGFDNNLILRPGPRVLQGLEALRTTIAEHATP